MDHVTAQAFQFLSNVVVTYGQSLDKVAQEPFLRFANQQMKALSTALDAPQAQEDDSE